MDRIQPTRTLSKDLLQIAVRLLRPVNERRLHCQIINVSNRAIEETAGIIMEYVRKNKERHHEN